jgi:hypothetical protein
MKGAPLGRTITVHTFRGDRTAAFRQRLFRALDDEQNGRGNGPSMTDCLLFTGHTGISINAKQMIYGFNPNGGTAPIWQMVQQLRRGRAYPGIVRDDTGVFAAAQQHGLIILQFEIVLSLPSFRVFQRKLTREWSKKSQYSYGFPNGDGDCNCTTWIERLGLPLLTGRMDEFTTVTGVAGQTNRRFGV